MLVTYLMMDGLMYRALGGYRCAPEAWRQERARSWTGPYRFSVIAGNELECARLEHGDDLPVHPMEWIVLEEIKLCSCGSGCEIGDCQLCSDRI